jgi:zinc protease
MLMLVGACSAAHAADGPDSSPGRKHEVPILEVEKYTLPNGLTVLLHQDHKTPVVAVNIVYKVGSKDEKPGRTGFAHLFEHMMFQGSQHHDHDYFLPLEHLGADLNGTTAEDQTEYYETVPSNALELALWLEADRMGFLLPAMTQAKLDNQRDVVKNERRQSVDNVPYGQAAERLLEALYPSDHPYHHSVIGSMADLSAGRLDDVSAFFRTYYLPNNAILCIAGDFQPERARSLVKKYFGPLARGPEAVRPKSSVPILAAAKHVQMTDAVSLPRAELVWPTVPANHPDEPALDVLAAVLGGLPKENRLFRALVYERQLAAQVDASHPTQLLSGVFEVELYARAGQKLDELVRIADTEIDRLKTEPPTAAEVRKAQNERESGLIMGLQSVTRKASVFSQYMASVGDPLHYRTELDKVFAVTPSDVVRVAKKYLGSARIRFDVLPGPPATRPPETAVDHPKQTATVDLPATAVHDEFDRSKMPALGPPPVYVPPTFARHKLSNGLELLIVERHGLPIVTLDLIIKSGETLAPKGRDGLGSIAASMLDEGTTIRTALQLAGELAEVGAALGADAGLESASVSLTTLTRHVDHALDLYADVILHSSFPEKELNRLKLERLAQLQARNDDPEQLAADVFPRLIYGVEHPYGRPQLGTVGSIRSITRDDVVAFCKQVMVPANCALVIVGDVRAAAITAALEGRLGKLAPGPAPKQPAVSAPPSASPTNRTIFLIDKPGAAQSVLTVGRIGAQRKAPDYFPLTLLNAVLGGQFSSRINMNLREDKGYSYGAQSSFAFLRAPGPFQVSGSVRTAVTKESLVEVFKELADITGSRTVTETELEFAKKRIIQGFPHRFETTFGVAGQLALLVQYELPDDELARYQSRIEAVKQADVDRVAREYITPEKFAVLVVGDQSAIENPLKSLPFVEKIQRLSAEGEPIPDKVPAKRSAARASDGNTVFKKAS